MPPVVDVSRGVAASAASQIKKCALLGLGGLRAPAEGGQQLTLDFQFSFAVLDKKQGGAAREILRGVNGSLQPGRLTAILGPSGAGKTSCLSILSGHRTAGVRGSVLVNGRERNMATYRQQCILIAQEFALLGALTVKETLHIATQLKLHSKYSSQDREDVVTDIVGILGLEACLDTFVHKLSGGERKRLSIGVELVTNPPIMFFDEPTSGLDSVSSVQVISHLRSLAHAGRTVAVVLHQPSSRLFQLFDDVLVLSAGRSLYCGPATRAAAAFAKAGFPCPTFYNIADFVVEVASGEHGENLDALVNAVKCTPHSEPRQPAMDSPDGPDAEKVPMLPTRRPSLTFDEEKDVIVEVEKRRPISIASPASTRPTSYTASFWVQFLVLLRRSLLLSWRDMHMAWLRFAAHVLVAAMLGFLYKDIGNEASKVPGNIACLFFFVLFLFFSNAMPTVLTFPLEAAVFFREYANNWYSLLAYYLSKVLADLPFLVLNPTVFVLLAYYLTDQPTDSNRRCLVWLVCVLTVLLAHAYGLVCGAAFGMQLATFLVPASTIPLILFSGFFLYLPDIPSVLKWLSYVSNFRYGFEGAVITAFGMNRKPLKCSLPYCHWKKPTKFLEDIGMINADYWVDVTGLCVWIIALHILLLITLKIKVVLSRR